MDTMLKPTPYGRSEAVYGTDVPSAMPDTVNPVNELSMHELHQRTLEKVLFLKDNGYNVIEIWTCDIDRQLAADPDMKRFFDNFEISEPLGTSSGLLWWSNQRDAALLRDAI